MRRLVPGLTLAMLTTFAAGSSARAAEDAKDAPASLTGRSEQLTPEEKQEREGRKACKVAICSAFRAKKTDGGDISCNVLKSWRKEQLDKLTRKAKVSWPWGKVSCTAPIHLKRADLVKAVTEPSFVAKLETHQVSCEVERDNGAPSKISFAFTPVVTFENGKATKASLKWGKVEAPTLLKGVMWTATATDNTFNVLQSTLVADINDFITNKCDEVKDEWAGK